MSTTAPITPHPSAPPPHSSGGMSCIRVAYCCEPHFGGTYTFYKLLRESVKQAGIDIINVYFRDHGSDLVTSQADDHSVFVRVPSNSRKAAAMRFVEWIEQEKIDILIPMAQETALDAIPHMPSSVKIIARCFAIDSFSYRATCTHRNHIERVAVSSQRQRDDLIHKYNISSAIIELIPHAVDWASFNYPRQNRTESRGLIRLMYLGRIVNRDKNVMLLPEITRRLDADGVPYCLDIIGSGCEEAELRSRFRQIGSMNRVRFLGPMDAEKRNIALTDSDVFIMPSVREGFGLSLIETMAAGIVPVASEIHGVTDWIVDNGQNGLLARSSDPSGFAEAIARLHRDRELLRKLGREASAEVKRRFAMEQFGDHWAKLLCDAVTSPINLRLPVPWPKFRPTAPLIPYWKRLVPVGLKSALKNIDAKYRFRSK